MFASDPAIEELIIGAGDISLIFSMETATKGYSSCVDLYALVEIFDVETDSDRLITSWTWNSTEVSAFQGVETNITIPGLPKDNTCFMVRITYGQTGKAASQQQRSTGMDCWWAKCELSSPDITLNSKPTASVDGNSFNWEFDTSVVGNEYCYTYAQ